MADLNVFELTNMELHKSEKKTVKESVKKISKKRKPFNIPLNKVKCESLSKFMEADGDEEVTVDYTPEDEVVLVIDPEMDEVPEDVDAAVEAAEELVGNHVCKCSICGANYVTDAEITEEVEMEDQECPVCGEVGDQIVVGVITPTDELSKGDEEDITDVEIEDEEEVTDDDGEEEFTDEEEEEIIDDEDEDFEESVRRARKRTLRRKAESVRKPAMRKPMPRKVMSKKPVAEGYQFDETTFNRMLTRFAKENYENVKFIKMSKGSIRKGTLTLEGIVTTTRGSKRNIKFVAENFTAGKRMSIKFKEYGPFTESLKNNDATFIVECVMKNNTITPMVLTYKFNTKNAGIKENRNVYSVTGKVLSESVRRFRK